MNFLLNLAEQGRFPDSVIEFGIRRLCKDRLKEIPPSSEFIEAERAFIDELKNSPIAIHTEEANEQHYELPPEFFLKVLGKRLKYSSCYFKGAFDDLDVAEEQMLDLTMKRAQIRDGDKILELGCGWGSITLWMAEHFPNSQITAVSNSRDQRGFIEQRLAEKNLTNVKVITADMNDFQTKEKFDRAISVEMFEHMRNYEELLKRISNWLNPDGTLFIHVFCHKVHAYPFEVKDDFDWMSKYFFTGGIMPSDQLYYYFNSDMKVAKHWRVLGTHYEKTARAWLRNQDEHREEILELFRETYGEGEEIKWFNRWRIFFLACAELFGYKNGTEWYVSHYLFKPKKA